MIQWILRLPPPTNANATVAAMHFSIYHFSILYIQSSNDSDWANQYMNKHMQST